MSEIAISLPDGLRQNQLGLRHSSFFDRGRQARLPRAIASSGSHVGSDKVPLGTEHAEDCRCNCACNRHVGGLGRGEGEAESLAGAMPNGAAGKGNMRLRTSKNRLPGGNVLSRFLEFLHAITH